MLTRSYRAGSLCVLLAGVIGCQSTPLVWKNPFAGSTQTEAEIEETELAEKSPKQTEPEAERQEVGRTQLKPIPEHNDLIDEERQASPMEQIWTQAEEALHAQNFPKATAFYREVVAMDPNHAEAHHRLGFLADQQSNFKLAEKHYLTAVRLQPDNFNFLNDLGMSYMLQGRLEESQNIFNHLLQLDPGNQLALQNLGSLSAKQGRLAEAFDYFRQSGFDYEKSKEMVLALQGESDPTMSQPAATEVTQSEPGVPYESPSTDWDSTYGLKNQAQLPANSEIVQTGNSTFREPQRESYAYENQPIAHNEPPIRNEMTSAPAQPVAERSYSDYSIERTALNSGPGRIFPVTTIPTDFPAYSPGTTPDPYNSGSLEQQLSSAADSYNAPAANNRPDLSVRQNTGMSIQTPPNYASRSDSTHAIPVTQDPYAANQPAATSNANTTRTNFDQFPSQPSATQPQRSAAASDPMRQFQSELESNPFGPTSTSRYR